MINSKNLFSLSVNRSKNLNSTVQPIIRTAINESSTDKLKRLGPNAIKDYFASLKNKEVVRKEIRKSMELVGLLDESCAKTAIQELTNPYDGVLLYLENTNDARSYVNKLPEEYQESVLEFLNDIDTIDRITSNDKKISSNKSMYNEACNFLGKNNKKAISKLASIIESFGLQPYQNMHIMIEESSYIISSHNIKLDMSKLVSDILEYYLMNTNENADQFKQSLTMYSVLDESDLNNVKYYLESNKIDSDYPSIKYIREWSNLHYHDEDYLERFNYVAKTNISETTLNDIQYNLPKLITYMSEASKLNKNTNALQSVYTGLQSKELSKDTLIKIKSSIEDLVKEYKVTSYEGKELVKEFTDYIVEDTSIMCKEYNNQIIDYLSENTDTISLNEFKKLKWKAGLLKAAFNLDRFLANKEKLWLKKKRNKLKKFTDTASVILFGENSQLESYIGYDRKADITVEQYLLDDIDESIYEFADSVCKEFNNQYTTIDDNVRSYYTLTEGLLSFHVKDKTLIEMEDTEFYAALSQNDPVMESYIEILESTKAYLEDLTKNSIVNPIDLFKRIDECANFTSEHYNMAMEVMQYLNITNEDKAYISEACKEYGLFITESSCKSNIDYVPIEVTIEANQILQDIFRNAGLQLEASMADDWDDEDDDEDIDNKNNTNDDKKELSDKKAETEKKSKGDKETKDKKDESPAVKMQGKYQVSKDDATKRTSFSYKKSLNSLKLAITGLHANFKKLNTKGKELVEKLDHNARAYAAAIKKSKADINRERIVSDSVVPAFKNIFKLSLMLLPLGGAAFLATKSILYPSIVVLGGLALNNRSLKKEKVIVLDEIETELEVLDKQLALADSNNQLNKYRELLKIKKELQRQYQRIKYSIKTSNKLYSSGIGAPNKEMD